MKCPHCYGTGYCDLPLYKNVKCTVCNGTGEVGMRCPHCDGKGRYKNIFGDEIACEICYGTGKVEYDEDYRLVPVGKQKPQTNDEWLRHCTAEELATFLEKVSGHEGICTVCDVNCDADSGCKYDYDKENDVLAWMDWLAEKKK